jgi:hypothetical protein
MSGVGEGLTDWLISVRGQRHVTGIKLHPAAKSQIGSGFVSIVETGRFKYWEGENMPLSDEWWFWKQVEACQYSLPENGRFDKDLRWGVDNQHKTETPNGTELTHDDRLLSASYVSAIDELFKTGDIIIGSAKSIIIQPSDPLANLEH